MPRKVLGSALLIGTMALTTTPHVQAMPTATAHSGLHYTTQSPTALRWQVANLALSYRGYRYAYVGDTPWSGFSCVGFVHYIFAQYGYFVPESAAIIAYSYPYVSPANLQPGDILLFTNTTFAGWSHAAIYLGGGQMIGADNFAVGVHVDSIYDSYWWSHWSSSVRVIP